MREGGDHIVYKKKKREGGHEDGSFCKKIAGSMRTDPLELYVPVVALQEAVHHDAHAHT